MKKPKDADRLQPKGKQSDNPCSCWGYADKALPVDGRILNWSSVVYTELGKSLFLLPIRQVSQT